MSQFEIRGPECGSSSKYDHRGCEAAGRADGVVMPGLGPPGQLVFKANKIPPMSGVVFRYPVGCDYES